MDHLTDQTNVKRSASIEDEEIWIVTTTNTPQILPGLKVFIQIRHNG